MSFSARRLPCRSLQCPCSVPAPVQSLPPNPAHRTESPRRGRRGRRPGQASQWRRIRSRIHPPSQVPKAVDRLGLRCCRPAAEFRKGPELQLPDGLARARLQERCVRVLGKPRANRVGTRGQGPHLSQWCAGEPRRLRKTVYLPSPAQQLPLETFWLSARRLARCGQN